MSNSCTMDEAHIKISLTLWGSDIMRSILKLHMMITKTPQNVHKIYVFGNLDDFQMGPQHHNVKLIFMNVIHIPPFWLFNISHIIDNFSHFFWTLFDILIHDLLLKPPQPGTGLFFSCYANKLGEFSFNFSIIKTILNTFHPFPYFDF